MRAALIDRYGPPAEVRIAEVPRPGSAKGRVLVRVEAAAVTSGDARIRAGRFPRGFGPLARVALGFRGPRRRILGVAFSGVLLEPAGEMRAGEAVAGMSGALMGAHAEVASAPVTALARKPEALGHAEAAGLLFGGSTALHFLRDRARIRPGDRVLVNGASGAVGSSAVQLARHLGARVTAVASGGREELMRALGAEGFVDYTRTPLEGRSGDFDVVFDAVGNLGPADAPRLLRPGGSLVLAVAGLADTLRRRAGIHTGASPERAEDFALLMELAARGELDPLTESLGGLDAIHEAYRRIDGGHKLGNLVIRPAD